MLPASAKDLIKQAKYAEAEIELIQLPTLGPRVMRELPPLFIIPGLMSEGVLRDFADQLLYPTFYASLPYNSLSFQDIAADLAEVSVIYFVFSLIYCFRVLPENEEVVPKRALQHRGYIMGWCVGN